MRGGSGFWLLGLCGGGAALLLGVLFLLHPLGDARIGAAILGGTALLGVAWRWFGRRFRDYI